MSSKRGAQEQRSERIPRKLDREKVKDLAAQGLSTADIAKHQNVASTTVWRFLRQLKPQQQQLDYFKDRRADCLAQIQGKSLDVQELVLESMRQELEADVITRALSSTAKARFLQAAVIAGGVSYDKERLERGRSTGNLSLLALQADAESLLFRTPPKRHADESEQREEK